MIRSFVLVLSLALATTGCDQGVGQRCQSTADCEDGLVCVVVQERGVCQSSSTPVGADAATDAPLDGAIDATAIDAAPPVDATPDA
ncbi:MAG: hypothetical protein KBG48_25900 [Kofleriaceae bacterium]|jgi:hypothetical protein|nr:hypothetical protein [Kofleriaceae bacterium]MBP9170857.1 hypothetical protein [Kofleriaceae bacterium]MBP9857628.1 hypothetical protein [Kofleriaceae bacterium]